MGIILCENVCDSLEVLINGYVIFNNDNSYGLMDHSCNIVIPLEVYDYIFSVSNDLICLSKALNLCALTQNKQR